MKVKKMIKALVAVLLIACSVLSFAACSEEKKEKSRDDFDTQYETKRYYFRQGYDDKTWKKNLECSEDTETKLVDGYEAQGLALQLVPIEAGKSVTYNIFCNWEKEGVGMVTSASEIAKKVADEGSRLFFNELNTLGEKRENYNQEEIVEITYNEMPWCQVKFTYNDADGDACKGVWNLLADGTNYYVVSYEGKTADYDAYFDDFTAMIEDFKKAAIEKE